MTEPAREGRSIGGVSFVTLSLAQWRLEMKPDLDKGSLPPAYVNAEIRRSGAALLVSHLTSLLRARALRLCSIVWNDGQGAHDRREWHTFRISSPTASTTLRISDEDLLALTHEELIGRGPVGANVREALDELARTEPASEAG